MLLAKTLSTRTHKYLYCEYLRDREQNSAINIWRQATTVGETGRNAWGVQVSTLVQAAGVSCDDEPRILLLLAVGMVKNSVTISKKKIRQDFSLSAAQVNTILSIES